MRQAGAADEKRDAADQAQSRFQGGVAIRVAFADQRPAEDQQQQRKRVSQIAEQIKRQIGGPRADRAADIVRRA